MSDIDRKIAEFVGCTVWMNDGSFAGAKYKGELIAHSELGLRNWLISSDGMRVMMEAMGKEYKWVCPVLSITGVWDCLIFQHNDSGELHFNIMAQNAPDLPTAVYEAVKQYLEGK